MMRYFQSALINDKDRVCSLARRQTYVLLQPSGVEHGMSAQHLPKECLDETILRYETYSHARLGTRAQHPLSQPAVTTRPFESPPNMTPQYWPVKQSIRNLPQTQA